MTARGQEFARLLWDAMSAARPDVAARAPLHPLAGVQWEQDRCPDCGAPGAVVADFGPLVEMACPRCEPGRFT